MKINSPSQLITEFSQLNHIHFSGELPLCTLTWNSRLQTSAGRFLPGIRSLLRKREPMIEVASYLQSIADGEKHIRDTMLHEMIHYYLWWKKRPYGHTQEFRTIMKRVGASRYNPVPKERPVKYWYQCASCLYKVPARRTLGTVACASCCKKFNRGYFSEKYLLKTISHAQAQEQKFPTHAVIEEKPEILPFEKVMETLASIRDTIKKAQIQSAPSSKN